VIVKSEHDLTGIVNASKVAKHILNVLAENSLEGVTTEFLDELCKKEMDAIGAKSAPKMFYDTPCYSFYSVNNCIVHGVPNRKELVKGDILIIDVTPFYEGFVSDTACSVIIGGEELNAAAALMINNVKTSFQKAVKLCIPNQNLNEIGRAIENNTKSGGYFVIKELSGHGVGQAVHEDPSVLNYYEFRDKTKLKNGEVIAIEPMISNRKSKIVTKRDGWSLATRMGSLTAHYEHTVLISDKTPIVLTE
jgi:methionyl aminopeptidase